MLGRILEPKLDQMPELTISCLIGLVSYQPQLLVGHSGQVATHDQLDFNLKPSFGHSIPGPGLERIESRHSKIARPIYLASLDLCTEVRLF